jgi:hypothetical protein
MTAPTVIVTMFTNVPARTANTRPRRQAEDGHSPARKERLLIEPPLLLQSGTTSRYRRPSTCPRQCQWRLKSQDLGAVLENPEILSASSNVCP